MIRKKVENPGFYTSFLRISTEVCIYVDIIRIKPISS